MADRVCPLCDGDHDQDNCPLLDPEVKSDRPLTQEDVNYQVDQILKNLRRNRSGED